MNEDTDFREELLEETGSDVAAPPEPEDHDGGDIPVISDEEEAELIKKARRGDGDAFGELMRKYETFIYNTVVGMINNAYDAQDVTQDAFFKAYRSMSGFRGDCRFSTWLYKIAKNTATDYLRSSSRHQTVSLDVDDNEDDDDERPMQIADDSISARTEDLAEVHDRQSAVRKAISRLSDNHRAVLVLRDIEGYSYDEISEMLGIEAGTVKSRLNRARLAVKAELIKMKIM